MAGLLRCSGRAGRGSSKAGGCQPLEAAQVPIACCSSCAPASQLGTQLGMQAGMCGLARPPPPPPPSHVAQPMHTLCPQLPEVPWGIISIKAQDEDYETPMQPITIMRNALGREEGGSGVPLDRAKYEQSTAYWERHAQIQ